ncbi:diacylglycerol kinase eta [Diorhabda carinulata]|uniref:diacylglycerol kinase eta n=1 Tax=Diorhabda carinulata TaxID=1163345 RepID=UPI0025A0C283|nr:diacylglycerol kinase eta [Diorhabda carinulata]XP_057656580.1 diacylglycerol kinase eta [Diorhabda carinulata]
MEDWLGALSSASQRRYNDMEPDLLSGRHHWYATSHARPTYCNVCRDALSGVTSHGLSCEICKCKAHKRCAAKAINNCKWTTLASVGHDITEDEDGNIMMPHQWMEGNLPVSAKCAVCEKNCGSVLRLQDWRCLWCRTTVHTQCRPNINRGCPLGPARVSVVPPTSLHSIQDEAWEAVRPQASSPLLVFVNSKSGDNQGVKFLRKFKQLLNPAQVFDLISTGPRLGLKLFRHFDPFRILVCSGDGSVGWVLSEIDKLDMHKQCQVAVLPLGTGNDLARVLGWGASCDDDTHLPQLLDKYEKASTKMLDRWSIMAFERTIAMPKLSLTPGIPEGQLHSQISQYEDSLVGNLQNILQSDDTSVILNSSKRLCETVKDFASQLMESSIMQGDEQLAKKCDILHQKLESLLKTLTSEQVDATTVSTQYYDESQGPGKSTEDTDSEISFDKAKTDKVEKDLNNFNFRKHRRTSRFMEREKDALLHRANSLKRAIRNLVEHTEQVVDEQNKQSAEAIPTVKISMSGDLDKVGSPTTTNKRDSLKPMSIIESGGSTDISSCPSPTSSIVTARLANISPMPDVRRDSTFGVEESDLLTLPVPEGFADSRRASQVQQQQNWESSTDKILVETATSLMKIEMEQNTIEEEGEKEDKESNAKLIDAKPVEDDEKESSSILSAISNEEVSITSEILDQKSFAPRKGSDGDDLNGHICHIDSPETDTYHSTSDVIHGESLMDDISSMLGEVNGYGLDSIDNTYTDDTTLFPSDLERKMSLKRNSLERKLRVSRQKDSNLDEDAQFGFENKAFMPQHGYLDNKTESEPPRYCSLAKFVEGNDIARRSFKRHTSSIKKSKCESTVTQQITLIEESEILSPSLHDSQNNLNTIHKISSNHTFNVIIMDKFKEISNDLERNGNEDARDKESEIKDNENEKDNLGGKEKEILENGDEKEEWRKFPQVSVIVEPPSPVLTEQMRSERMGHIRIEIEGDVDPELEMLCSKADRLTEKSTSNASSNSNLLGVNPEHFLVRSPAATRRISCCSMLNPTESAALAAAANTSKFYEAAAEKKDPDKKEEKEKKLPIINPLVRLPTWPDVNSGGGFISKCLLANADTLCAAVSPLIDPDETLSEGFYERCVMNNYFGIGIDAKISLDFHQKREEHPEKCRSRAKNYMWYGVLGSKQLIQKTYKNLEQRVQIECDGQRIPLPSLQGIVILNIPSFMGGINFWGTRRDGDIFLTPSFDDKILEVVAVFGSVQMAASRLINLQHHRIAQCQSVQISILGDEGVPIQVDGEAWIQPPGIIRIIHKNRMQMLCRNRSLENSLKTWEEKQRQSISAQGAKHRASISHDLKHRPSLLSHDKGRSSLTRQSMPSQEKSFLGVNFEKIRQHSFSGAVPTMQTQNIEKEKMTVTFLDTPLQSAEPDILFTEEEHHLLINFIECIATLTKWIKILAISYNFENDLYTLAKKIDTELEKLHPNGKLLTGPSLREEFTKLVNDVKQLYEESCALLHDRGDKLKLRDDLASKLSASLANAELELRRCVIYDTSIGSLVYLQAVQNQEHKRKGHFWLKFRNKGSGSLHYCQKNEVASWGTQEVATWLETLQLAEYVESFVKNDVRGRELLTLARRDLKDLGVTKVGHVKRILQAIKDLTQGL